MVGNGRLESKCEVYIQNIRKEDVRKTLWGDTTRTFDFQALERLAPPIITVFTSLKVKQFQGLVILHTLLEWCLFMRFNRSGMDGVGKIIMKLFHFTLVELKKLLYICPFSQPNSFTIVASLLKLLISCWQFVFINYQSWINKSSI
ncbi:unnamed protein product, partial [Prunus brigantina]